jgi:hypothetical protein
MLNQPGFGVRLEFLLNYVRIGPENNIHLVNVVVLWDAFYSDNKRFDLDTPKVPSRSPTPTSKSNDALGQSEDIWGARGSHFRPMLGVPGVRAGLTHIYIYIYIYIYIFELFETVTTYINLVNFSRAVFKSGSLEHSGSAGRPGTPDLNDRGPIPRKTYYINEDLVNDLNLILVRIRPESNRHFGFSYMFFWPGNFVLLVRVAPAAPNTIPEGGGGLRPPPSGMVFGATGAAQTPNIDDFRPVQKPCIQKPKCNIHSINSCRALFEWVPWSTRGRRADPPARPPARRVARDPWNS